MDEGEGAEPGGGEDTEITLGARAFGWFKRALGHWLVGLVCVPLTVCVVVAAKVFGVLGAPPPVRVEPLLPLYPFAWWSDSAAASPLMFQFTLAYALVVWLVLTTVRGRRDPEQGRATSPLVVTAALTCVGGLVFRLGGTIDAFEDALALSVVWAVFSLPTVVLATAWRSRLAPLGDARAVITRWAVVVVLVVASLVAGVRPAPPVGANLSERDAWAREHMGERYVGVASDLTSAEIITDLMGEDVRVGPVAPSSGELVLDMDEGASLEGVMLLDDGVRAARCEVDYDFSGSFWSQYNGAICTRNGTRIYLRSGHPELYSLESTDAPSQARIVARHPERFAALEVELRAALARYVEERKTDAYDLEAFQVTVAESHGRTDGHQIALEGEVSGPADFPRLACKVAAMVDHDGAAFVPEDADTDSPCRYEFD